MTDTHIHVYATTNLKHCILTKLQIDNSNFIIMCHGCNFNGIIYLQMWMCICVYVLAIELNCGIHLCGDIEFICYSKNVISMQFISYSLCRF